jgi:hypothetical protein
MNHGAAACRICGKSISEALVHESKLLIERLSVAHGIDPPWLMNCWHPLCQLCRQNIEQAQVLEVVQKPAD